MKLLLKGELLSAGSMVINMSFYTKSMNINWDRVVDLFVSYNNDIKSSINDTDAFKLLILTSGILHINSHNEELSIISPALICLSNSDYIEVLESDSFKAVTVYFKPTVIHDSLTYTELGNINESTIGTTLYQDYLLVKPFISTGIAHRKVYNITNNSLISILSKIDNINHELCTQYDGYWPCRSRSYLIELLFFISFSCIGHQSTNNTFTDPLIAEIINYLNEHINDRILLKDITREFSINRNSLNKVFMDNTNTTCLNYLLKLRIDLAKIMLAETELPVSEIGERVGFLDANYFTKAFKKANNVTPSCYRINVKSKDH